MSKYGHRPHNWFEAIVNKLGGEEAAEAFLKGRLVVTQPSHSWIEEDGIITCSVDGNDLSMRARMEQLELNGHGVSDSAKDILCSMKETTLGSRFLKVTILKGELFEDMDRLSRRIREEAKKRGLMTPTPELAYFLREKFRNNDLETMNLVGITVMHEPVSDVFENHPGVLVVFRGNGGMGIHKDSGRSIKGWTRRYGFAFLG